VHVLKSQDEVDTAVIERQPLWNNRKHERGPFDIIGDVHGCCDELEDLLQQLGYTRDGTRLSPMLRLVITVTLRVWTLRRAALLAAVVALCGCSRHPSDERLLEAFREHRSELEQLIRMFQHDKGLGRVGENFTRPDDPGRVGVSNERISEYRRLCAAIAAPACIEGYDAAFDKLYGPTQEGRTEFKNPIWIHVSTAGLAVSGSSKGFLYSAAPPFEIVGDLNSVAPNRSGTWLRHIEGPWYIYFDYDD